MQPAISKSKVVAKKVIIGALASNIVAMCVMTNFAEQDRGSTPRLEQLRQELQTGPNTRGLELQNGQAGRGAGGSGSERDTVYLDLVLLSKLGCWLRTRRLWTHKVSELLGGSASLKSLVRLTRAPKRRRQLQTGGPLASPTSGHNSIQPNESNPRRGAQDAEPLKRGTKMGLIVQMVAIKLVTLAILQRIAEANEASERQPDGRGCAPILLAALMCSFAVMYHYYDRYYRVFLANN